MSGAGSSPQDLVRLSRPFKVVAFDWDGTAVGARKDDSSRLNDVIDRLLAAGVLVVVLSDMNVTNTMNQLQGVVRGDHNRELYIAANRGAEVWGFDGTPEPILLWTRKATPDEERAMSEAADEVRDLLAQRNRLDVTVAYDRLNRRKIDLLPAGKGADTARQRSAELLEAVERRLHDAGVEGGLHEVLRLTADALKQRGLEAARVTTDLRSVEIGLTDTPDAIDWMVRELCRGRGIRCDQILVAGDQFGAVGPFEGRDLRMLTLDSRGAVFVSVGAEPGGVPGDVAHLGGGPERFRQLLIAQAEMHEAKRTTPERGRVKLPLKRTADPAWVVVEQGFEPAREHEIESLMAVANGYLGTRGSLAEGATFSSSPATFIAGVFDTPTHPPAVPELAVAPNWTSLRITVEGSELRLSHDTLVESHRSLDMRQGVSWREWRHRDSHGRITLLRGIRVASLDDRHVLAQSIVVVPENYSGHVLLEAFLEPPPTSIAGIAVKRPNLVPVDDAEARAITDLPVLTYRAPGPGIDVSFAMRVRFQDSGAETARRSVERREGTCIERIEVDAEIGKAYRLDRLVAVYTTRDTDHPAQRAAEALRALESESTDTVCARHVGAWRSRWESTEIEIDGDDESARALRFAAYHLIGAANPEDERVSIGARTLTGDSYKGHVFWDTDIFINPFFNFTHPESSRALLMYRFHTLPAARAKARAMGYRGALYAWESADTGEETTPRFMLAPDGEVVRILSGDQEHHISADVAYAAWDYWQASGDDAFMVAAGAEIVLETARFWASRGKLESDGRYHLREIIGPDEYHEGIDDNAYTNLLAQWNMERGIEIARWMEARYPEEWAALRKRLDVTADELREWDGLARAMYTGFDEGTGLYEQFRGYFDLEDFDFRPIRASGKVAAPMDMLLGRPRTKRSKVVKQADVVMMLHLLWEKFPPHVREANFRYYEPRTCHGSSLSPAVHASVAARLGDMKTAEEYFKQAARIDLANNMGNAAGGVHAAALGGLWQAAVFGFAGLQVRNGGLVFNPNLPPAWSALRIPLQHRGAQLLVTVERDVVRVRHLRHGPALVLLEGGEGREVTAGREILAARGESGWQGWQEVRA